MADMDTEPPIPPKPSDYEENKGEDKEKKGFFKRVFKKKEESKPEEEAPKQEEQVNDDKEADKDLDEISKLIDDTINDIQKLQEKNVPSDEKKEEKPEPVVEEKPVEETPKEEPTPVVQEKPTTPEVPEPPKIEETPKVAKLDLASIEGNKPEKKPVSKPSPQKPAVKKAASKPVAKPAVKKAVKKAPKKPVVKKVETKKNYSLPKTFAKQSSKPASSPPKQNSIPSLDTPSQIALVKQELKSIPNNPVSAKNPFILQNGTKLNNLQELVKCLDSISDNDWNYHVTINKNDFASWIRSELKSPQLATEFRKFLIKTDAVKVLKEELAEIPNREKRKTTLNAKLKQLEKTVEQENKTKKFSAPPQEFFKVDNKLISNINELNRAMNSISSKEFAAYVTSNKENFKKWLTYLTRDYQKEINDFKKQYNNLHTQVIKGVSDKVDTKIKEAKTELEKISKEKQKEKTELQKIKDSKKVLMSEQKDLAAKKKKLLTEVAQVNKEHKQVHALRDKTQKEKDMLHNQIKDAQEELKNQKKMLDEQTKAAKAELAVEERRHKLMLSETKKQAKMELKDLQNQIKNLDKQVKAEEVKIKKEYERLNKKQVDIEARDAKSKEREAAVTRREDAFESEKVRIENLVKNFEEREKEIELKKSELEVAGFQKYLETKLSEIQTTDSTPGSFDQGIKAARKMITSNDVDGAKQKYLELKSDFESSGLSGAEKDRVFNLLRELYDDIMLAMNN